MYCQTCLQRLRGLSGLLPACGPQGARGQLFYPSVCACDYGPHECPRRRSAWHWAAKCAVSQPHSEHCPPSTVIHTCPWHVRPRAPGTAVAEAAPAGQGESVLAHAAASGTV